MTAPALRVVEAHAQSYRRTWQGSVVTTFLNPVLFLLAMGLGLGTLVDRGEGVAALSGLSYLEFLAPGLLAATAMQVAAGESTWPVMLGIKWQKTYYAVLATPVRPRDIVVGNLAWAGVRLALSAGVFVLVMVVFGVAALPAGALAVLPAVLTGLAFSAPIAAFTASVKNEYALAGLFRFGIVPLFLFSGTFFPIDRLPAPLQPVAYATPLWHGVELCRAAALGVAPALPAVIHAGYLALWLTVGATLAVWAFDRRLIT